MIKKTHFIFLFLIITCISCFVASIFNFNTARAIKQPVVFQEKIEQTGFSGEFWNASDNSDGFAFTTKEKNYESTVSTKNVLSGSYSVTFNFGKLSGTDNTPIQIVVALGADKQTRIPLNNNDAYFNTPDDNTIYLAFAGTKVFIFDRNGNDYQERAGGKAQDELGTTYWKHLYNYYANKGIAFSHVDVKLEVVSGQENDTLNMYFSNSASFSSTPDCSVTLHKKGVCNGYLQFSQAKAVYKDVIGSFSVNNLKINELLTKKSDLTVLGDDGLVDFISAKKSTLFDNAVDEKIISTFEINDDGLQDGEEVFSITFTERRFAEENNDHAWGFVFGVDKSGDLSTGKEIKIARNGVREADVAGGVCVYHCTKTPIALSKLTYTIKGYKGGKIEISYNDYSECPTHTAVYNDVDFNGKVALKIFNDSGLDGGFWEISNFSLDCLAHVEKDVELRIENQEKATLIVGDTVKLSTNMECDIEIVEGKDIASLEDNMLTTKGAGKVVVKATVKDDQEKFALFTLNVTDKVNYNFEYRNTFESAQDINSDKNACDFYVINAESGEIGINNALFFKNTVGATEAQVGLITPFAHDYQNGIVFDITFTVTIDNGNSKVRNKNYTCGFAFGLDEIGAKPLSEGSGAILINCVRAEMYNNGAVVKPTYVTTNKEGDTTTYGKDSFGCYADSTNPLTVRLVAKSDGTLEFYRGIVYRRVGEKDIGTYVTDLFATYSGFDFNGYVAMFTNNTILNQYTLENEVKDDDCEIKFDNLIVKGNYRLDKNLVPEIKDLGVTSTLDLLHTELPIELDYYIYAVPNLEIYKGYKVEVLSGNATIDEHNRLITTGAGTIKLKITSEADTTRFKEIEFNIGELKIDSVEIDESLFVGLTNDSQAFFLNAKLKGENTHLIKYLNIDYEVLEGNVSIIDGYLYVNGTGNAKIRIYSHYLPSVEKVIEFNIADNDLQYQTNEVDVNLTLIIGVVAVVVVLALAIIITIIVRKSRKGE